MIDYVEALRNAELLDKDSEFKAKIIEILDEMEIFKLKTARKLVNVLKFFDEENLANDIYNKNLDREIDALKDYIEYKESGGDSISSLTEYDKEKAKWLIKKTDELIGLLKELGDDKEIAYWENRKKRFKNISIYGRPAPLP